MKNQVILVLDFGAQYSQLIARRVREARVYCEILPHNTSVAKIRQLDPVGIILSGGPSSVYGQGAPQVDPEIWKMGIPVLGICYGMQLMAHQLGGDVQRASHRELGRASMRVLEREGLFAGIEMPLEAVLECWMSHQDRVETPPAGFKILAETESAPVAAMGDSQRRFYGLQFHPEVVHTPQGQEILENFLFGVCQAKGDWTMSAFVESQITQIREKVGAETVICGLSGGVDSSVAAALVHQAIGDQLTCIFVNHGLLRQGEVEQVLRIFGERFSMRLVYVDAAERFLTKLAGVTDPERKRKIIGEEFIRVFEEEATKFGDAKYLVQGTVYPDVIESGTQTASVIKSHHNVGGLPEDIEFQLLEPLRYLFKDEVRKVGEELGLPEEIVWRHPFPGPGLAIRVIGAVSEERLSILRRADAIFIEEIRKAGLYRRIWQAFAVLTDTRSVGVVGDERTYEHVLALRAVTGHDAMTADWFAFEPEVLSRISSRIINEIAQVGRVVYDITSKPPGTIEWE